MVAGSGRAEAALAHNQEHLVFYLVGNLDTTQLQRAYPASYFHFFQLVEDIGKGLCLFVGVFVAFASLERIEFFVIVIYDFFRYGSK